MIVIYSYIFSDRSSCDKPLKHADVLHSSVLLPATKSPSILNQYFWRSYPKRRHFQASFLFILCAFLFGLRVLQKYPKHAAFPVLSIELLWCRNEHLRCGFSSASPQNPTKMHRSLSGYSMPVNGCNIIRMASRPKYRETPRKKRVLKTNCLQRDDWGMHSFWFKPGKPIPSWLLKKTPRKINGWFTWKSPKFAKENHLNKTFMKLYYMLILTTPLS